MNSLMRRDCMIPDYYGLNGLEIPITESPEAVIARQHPLRMLELLDNESQRRCDVASLNVGGNIAQSYLQCLESEDTAKISDIGIKLLSERRFLGFITSDKGILISFYRS